MSVNPTAFRRLVREIKQLQTEPPEGIRISTDEENILDVTGIIQGPDGTPYQGGYFRVKFKFTEEFPAAPPKCWFITKIFHPNVSKAGEICVNTLKKDWKREYGIGHILVTIKCLLIYPNPESALDEAAGKLLLEKYEDYCKHAKLMTSVHATPKIRPPEFDIPSVIPDAKPVPTLAPADAVTSSTSATLATATPPATTRAPSPNPSTVSSRHTTPAPGPLLSLNSNPDTAIGPAPTKPLSKTGGNIPPTATPVHVEPLQSATRDQNVDPKTQMMDATPSEPAAKPSVTAAKTTTSGTKRSGAATTGGVEKRKKGLKRL